MWLDFRRGLRACWNENKELTCHSVSSKIWPILIALDKAGDVVDCCPLNLLDFSFVPTLYVGTRRKSEEVDACYVPKDVSLHSFKPTPI